jgi:hypothetical protein
MSYGQKIGDGRAVSRLMGQLHMYAIQDFLFVNSAIPNGPVELLENIIEFVFY